MFVGRRKQLTSQYINAVISFSLCLPKKCNCAITNVLQYYIDVPLIDKYISYCPLCKAQILT